MAVKQFCFKQFSYVCCSLAKSDQSFFITSSHTNKIQYKMLGLVDICYEEVRLKAFIERLFDMSYRNFLFR